MLRVFKQYYPIRNVFFILIEGLLIFQTVIISAFILNNDGLFYIDSYFCGKAFLITFCCQLCLYYNDLYDLKMSETYGELFKRLFQSLGAASIIIAGIYGSFRDAAINQNIFITSSITAIFVITLWRTLYNMVLDKGLFDKHILLIGDSTLAENIAKNISGKKDSGYTVTVVSPEEQGITNSPQNIPTVQCDDNYEGLLEIAKRLDVESIVVSFNNNNHIIPDQELLKCRVNGIKIIDGNSFHEMLSGKLYVTGTDRSWLIFSDGFDTHPSHQILKTLLDFCLSLVLLVVLSPLILFTAILIKLESKGPVFFSQARVGKNNKEFNIYKFRSMVSEAEKESGPVWAKNNDTRITKIGKFIRKTRIDEIPQLWNVLKGDMSFVGPRPERKFFIEKLQEQIPYYGERAIVKPGITGWAQVNYGYGATIEDAIEKLNYDLYYIKNGSVYMDVYIIFRTVKTVLFGVGAR